MPLGPAGSPAIILVEPQLGENIGMVARAMANFGLADLRLVKPRDGWPSESARATAAKAVHVVEAASLFDTVEEAVGDLTFVLATTARERDGFKPVFSPIEAARGLRARAAESQTTGILFGRERFGLFNEEIARADAIVTFPVDPEFASLNIAQAALLMAYEWMRTGLTSDSDTAFSAPSLVPAERRHVVGLLDQVEAALSARGYFRPLAKKPKMLESLRAVFMRPGFTEAEIKVLRGVVSSLDRFSPVMPRGEGSPGDDPRRKPAAHAQAGSVSDSTPPKTKSGHD